MIELRDKRIVVDGEPRLVLAGEVHYFRVPRAEWAQRLDLLQETGCNAVASYLPWLFHELPDGTIDVEGRTRPERDVGAFVDECHRRGLWFIARPGPFVMAELKNEGIPHRVYREHPEIVPSGWDGRPAPTRTVDYLAPAFLAETARWYDAVMPVLAPRLQPRGGPVITVQLDNEVGMLAWVSNSPDLTDGLLADFCASVDGRFSPATVRTPDESVAGRLRVDLGRFMRSRFAAYVRALRTMAEERDVRDVPFAVNLHGTADGSGTPFPIGISQLVETYAGVPRMLSGSDHYLGAATSDTLTDLYVMNAFMDAVHDRDQPLTSLEFEAGTGDYGAGLEVMHDPSTVDLKTRLCVAQGNRLINYYLLAGGTNPPLDVPVGDGNDRLGFTGERHGTAAPIGPEGQRGIAFEATSRTVHAVTTLAPWLARMDEEHDDVVLGLTLDAYATEYHHPDSAEMTAAVADLAAHRGAGPRRALARSLLLLGYRYGAVHLEQRDPEPGQVLALASGRRLGAAVQERVLRHVDAGGRLLYLGPLPELDLDGSPCTVLADGLGLAAGDLLRETPHTYPSVVPEGLAAPGPEVRVGWRQRLAGEGYDVVLRDVDGAVCGLASGSVVVMAAEVPSDPALFGRVLVHLGSSPGVPTTAPWPGIITTTTAGDGQRALHLLNHAPVAMDVGVLDRTLRVPARSGHVLALGLDLPVGRVTWASAEVTAHDEHGVTFGPGLDPDGRTTVDLAPGARLAPDPDLDVTTTPDGTLRVVGGPGPVTLRVAAG